jgi:hypothetical protein
MEPEPIAATCPACGRDARTAAKAESLAWCSCLLCGSVDLERREKILGTLRAHHIDRPDDLENIAYRLEIWRGRNEASLGLLSQVREERDTERAARQAVETERERLREALAKAQTGLLALNEHHTQVHHRGHLGELDERVADALLACRFALKGKGKPDALEP